MRRRPQRLAFAVLCALTLSRSGLVAAGDDEAPPWRPVGAAIVRLVREKFCSAEQGRRWAERHAAYWRSARTTDEFDRLTRQALAELKTSHTSYHTPGDVGYYGLLAIFGPVLGPGPTLWESIGADFTDENFVRRVFAGGPAAAAGLLRGDRVLEADGRPFHPIHSFKERSGKAVELGVERQAGAAPLTLTVRPRRIDVRAEWREALREGTRLIEKDGARIGYIPLFANPGEEAPNEVKAAMAGKLAAAQAVILDLRDGWGGCDPALLSIFPPEGPTLQYKDRDGKPLPDSGMAPRLTLLINGGSRSAKELIAYEAKKRRLGTLVGERTAGAVVAGQPFLLPDRSLLYLAVRDLTVDGERLEGKGVEPDVAVPDRLRYAAGADPQLDEALRIAAKGSSRR